MATPILQKPTETSIETGNSAKLEICDPINSLTDNTLPEQPEPESKSLEAEDRVENQENEVQKEDKGEPTIHMASNLKNNPLPDPARQPHLKGHVGDLSYILIGSAGTELKAKNISKKVTKLPKTVPYLCLLVF